MIEQNVLTFVQFWAGGEEWGAGTPPWVAQAPHRGAKFAEGRTRRSRSRRLRLAEQASYAEAARREASARGEGPVPST